MRCAVLLVLFSVLFLLPLGVSLRCECVCFCEPEVGGSQVCKSVQVRLAGLVVCGVCNFANPNSPCGVPFVGGLSPSGASELQLQLQLLLLAARRRVCCRIRQAAAHSRLIRLFIRLCTLNAFAH